MGDVQRKRRRVIGPPINYKSLTRAPVNELGVVYLFGVLHDTFDFEIESIQAGFPDCTARRKIKENQWEEVRIEFEYRSSSFVAHGHDPNGVDIIVCWLHDWQACPEHIEVIELSALIGDVEEIGTQLKKPKKLTAWQQFCQEKRLEGLNFAEIAKLWRATQPRDE